MRIIYTFLMLCLSSFVMASPLNGIVVFGDSLSDNGNLYQYMKHQLPVSPPYYNGRFTNGPVWIEQLVAFYYPNKPENHLLDYAYGGAGVLEDDNNDDDFFTLRREIDGYFLSHDKADENSMYVIWIGSNNYLAIPDDTEKALKEVETGIEHELERLVQKGAKHILVVNVPDLGRTPVASEFDAVDVLTYLSLRHNATLKQNMAEYQHRYPDVQWLYFDVGEAFNDLINNPAKFGFTNVTGTCYEAASSAVASHSVLKMVSTIKAKPQANESACDGYLFFDPVHPSVQVHRMMAERTKKLFDESGVTFE